METLKTWTASNQRFLRIAFGALVTVSILGIVGLGAYLLTRRATLALINAPQAGGPAIQQAAGGATPAPGETPLAIQQANPSAPQSLPTLTPWNGVGRVTILLLGLDYRTWETSTDYNRSDTMILLSLDPLTRQAGILTIPRDLWVGIPGFQHGKINTAYYLGEAYKLPGGGPGLAVKTVEKFLGIPINYYAQIDFGAFIRFIDEIGGVKVNVNETITIDLLGAGPSTKKTLKPGVQVLPGQWALAYARQRYTQGGDFDRSRRQIQVIMGIRDRILSQDMLARLVEKAPALYAELSSGIHTNLSLDEALRLGVLAAQVNESDIRQGSINDDYVLYGQSPDNLSILIPLPDKILQLRDQIFVSGGALGPLTPGSELERAVAEQPRLAVRNASSDPSLGTRAIAYLNGLSLPAGEGAAVEAGKPTTLIVHTGRPYTLSYLQKWLNLPALRIILRYDPASPVDIEVVLGNDWAGAGQLP